MVREGLIGLALATALTGMTRAQPNLDLVKRGDHLVNTVLTCGNCHSPKGPDGRDIAAKAFSGGLSWERAAL